jgi:hypothetical protein
MLGANPRLVAALMWEPPTLFIVRAAADTGEFEIVAMIAAEASAAWESPLGCEVWRSCEPGRARDWVPRFVAGHSPEVHWRARLATDGQQLLCAASNRM